jgi:hypothetical protein
MRRHTLMAVAVAGVLSAAGAASAATLTVTGGLKLWLKADAGVTTFGGEVVSWTDSSGNGNDAIGTPGSAPTYIASDPAIQNLPALNFNSINQRLNAGSNVDLTQLTIFSVFRATDLGFGAIVDMVNPSPLSENYALLTGHDTGQQIWHLQWNNGSFDNINTGFGNPNYLNTWTIRTDRHDGAGNAAMYQNGNLLVSSSGDTNPATNANNQLWIGHYQVGSTGYFGGQMAEILIYDTALSTQDRQAVEAYLNEKYITGPIPEPSTALLAAGGVVLLAGRRRSRRA